MTVALSDNAPREVRHSLEAEYLGSMERSLLDDLTLCTSEVVTNAVKHSGRPDGDPLTVETTVIDGVLRVEVTDEGAGVDHLEPRSIDPPSGLGYLQVLSDRWSSRANSSFHVWFEINVVSRSTLYRAPPDSRAPDALVYSMTENRVTRGPGMNPEGRSPLRSLSTASQDSPARSALPAITRGASRGRRRDGSAGTR